MIKCEVYFGNKDFGEMKEACLDFKTGFVFFEGICASDLTAPRKWVEFVYDNQKFELKCHVQNGKIRIKDNKNLSSIGVHMNLENSLIKPSNTCDSSKKMKI